jgi:organic radical activating enzyme
MICDVSDPGDNEKDYAGNSGTILVENAFDDNRLNIAYPEIEKRNSEIFRLSDETMTWISGKMTVVPKEHFKFEINLADQCNLNCQMCDHFSNISPVVFVDVDVFDRDFRRMSELCGSGIAGIELLGGEPLLHPRIAELMEMARNYFTETGAINIWTNGLLLKSMNSDFWKSCGENAIQVHLTKYPVDIDVDGCRAVAARHGVLITVEFDDCEKMSYKPKLDPSGSQPVYSHAYCAALNNCRVLKNGRMFNCPSSAYIDIFNDYFGWNFRHAESDSVDIYRITTYEELAEFTTRRSAFCSYCVLEGRGELSDWRRSSRTIEEYL